MLDGIHHPSFKHVTPTKYVLHLGNHKDDNDLRVSIHVGQLVDFLTFDEALRNGRKLQNNLEVPLGYHTFCYDFLLISHSTYF